MQQAKFPIWLHTDPLIRNAKHGSYGNKFKKSLWYDLTQESNQRLPIC